MMDRASVPTGSLKPTLGVGHVVLLQEIESEPKHSLFRDPRHDAVLDFSLVPPHKKG